MTENAENKTSRGDGRVAVSSFPTYPILNQPDVVIPSEHLAAVERLRARAKAARAAGDRLWCTSEERRILGSIFDENHGLSE